MEGRDLAELARQYVEDKPPRTGELHPSSLGDCPRRTMMEFRGEKVTSPMTAWLRWNLERQSWYEDLFASVLTKRYTRTYVRCQEPLALGPWRGRPDFLVYHVGRPSRFELVEVKTYGSSKRVSDMPADEAKWQTWCYLLMVSPAFEEPEEDILATLLYIERWSVTSRKVPKIREFDVTPKPEDLDHVRWMMAQLEGLAGQEELPEIPFENPREHRWQCISRYFDMRKQEMVEYVNCPYFGHCWPDQLNEAGELGIDEEELPF